MLRKLSQNPLMVDNRPVDAAEAIPIPDGTRLSLGASADAQQVKFLVFRVTIRSQGAVKAEGAHPAAKTARRNSAPSFHMQAVVEHSNVPAPAGLVAVLECTYARGVDVARLGPELRAIHLTKDTIDIGRHHQVNYFEKLLANEPQWLGFISRSHCRAQLIGDDSGAGRGWNLGNSGQQPGTGQQHRPAGSSGRLVLRVENLSQNVVVVGGALVAKGRAATILEGGKIGFVAKSDGSAETKFLELMVRRAKVGGDAFGQGSGPERGSFDHRRRPVEEESPAEHMRHMSQRPTRPIS
jgi:hypothetical protein